MVLVFVCLAVEAGQSRSRSLSTRTALLCLDPPPFHPGRSDQIMPPNFIDNLEESEAGDYNLFVGQDTSIYLLSGSLGDVPGEQASSFALLNNTAPDFFDKLHVCDLLSPRSGNGRSVGEGQFSTASTLPPLFL